MNVTQHWSISLQLEQVSHELRANNKLKLTTSFAQILVTHFLECMKVKERDIRSVWSVPIQLFSCLK